MKTAVTPDQCVEEAARECRTKHPEDLPKLLSHSIYTLFMLLLRGFIGGKYYKHTSLLYSVYICLFSPVCYLT